MLLCREIARIPRDGGKVIHVGATPMTSKWTEQSKRFILNNGDALRPKGKLALKSDQVKQLAERIDKVHANS
jgi:hypothetical protein